MTDLSKMDGPDKAAIFLLSLGQELATPIMKQMDDESLVEIAQRMPKLANIGPETLIAVYQEYEELHNSGNPMFISSAKEVEDLLKNVVDGERLQHILESLEETEPSKIRIWTRLARLKPKAIHALIKNENPQTIAIILGHLDPALVSEVLQLLDEGIRMAVVLRMAKIESVPTELVRDIEDALECELMETAGGSGLAFDGLLRVVEMLKSLDSNISKPILDHLREKDPELFEQIDSQLLVFEDFLNLSDRDIQAVLKHVSSEDLVRSLKGASDDVRHHFFKNMSKRAADIMREDMEVMGPLKVSDVEKAQRAILEVARKLDEEGEITLGGQEDLVY